MRAHGVRSVRAASCRFVSPLLLAPLSRPRTIRQAPDHPPRRRLLHRAAPCGHRHRPCARRPFANATQNTPQVAQVASKWCPHTAFLSPGERRGRRADEEERCITRHAAFQRAWPPLAHQRHAWGARQGHAHANPSPVSPLEVPGPARSVHETRIAHTKPPLRARSRQMARQHGHKHRSSAPRSTRLSGP